MTEKMKNNDADSIKLRQDIVHSNAVMCQCLASMESIFIRITNAKQKREYQQFDPLDSGNKKSIDDLLDQLNTQISLFSTSHFIFLST